ncbi:FG-GAP-like repeat-containing protein [Marivirga salinae]|uniref:FG-GAP-like repeat-containing protein n=1 Tax=Marivirga salinarum TaxID=3059078 RepID=A0AA51NC40_9BACT|nr:FG-GAP-like repeat-containing protein [Marivirga sp. BDSF4-3]WMN12320.1 FG-GAP-like repeat-containing protein [Marivirga sp. BDSF4-3]
MINIKPSTWTGTYQLPARSDVRWRAFGLLFLYLVLGMTVLGFSRQPMHIFILIAAGALLDVVLSGLLRGRKIFPLSAMISCSSLALILNWSFGMHNLWLPVFICIASKYLITLKGKHFFNPSLFAICVCILLGSEYVTLAPAYQWYGSAETAWLMGFFIVTGALFLFYFKINRGWLIGSFLLAFFLQTILRAYIMEHIIPWETLFIGSLTSPAFYLFTFYMITDPATSPSKKSDQIIVGLLIAFFDLLFHLKFSLYTFFFAGITVAGIRYLYFLGKQFWTEGGLSPVWAIKAKIPHAVLLFIFSIPVLLAFNINNKESLIPEEDTMNLKRITSEHSGLGWAKSCLLEQTDPRLAHVAKWILSVGDASAVADINKDGLPDIFLTQPLKASEWKAKLYINKGNLSFEKINIPDLDHYLDDPVKFGVPGFAFFMDYDNDGDKDLFVGFGFGKSHLFENLSTSKEDIIFKEVKVPFLENQHTVCLAANAFDYDNDGYLDLLITNTLQTHLPAYKDKREELNIFKLPEPAYEGDDRMFQFMHESWHNANNGGLNYLLKNNRDSSAFSLLNSDSLGLGATRWSLAVGTVDINNDGFTDLYIANDFGRDDCYLNMGGKYFKRQEGEFYGDLGLDTYKGMNVSVGDLDKNGKEDVYISNVHHAMQAEGSLLWMNYTEKDALKADFEEQASQLNALNTNRFGWGAAIGDLNLNGWQDIVQANGMVDASWDPKFEEPADYWYYQAQIARTGPEIHSFADKWADIRGCYIYPNEPDRILINNYGKGFVDIAEQLDFNHQANTRGVALVDFDNDGDLDILITDQFGAPILYENELKNHNWVGLRLKGNGHTTNSEAVGSKVWIIYEVNGGQQEQYREMRLVNGFSAMGDSRLLFGLGHKKHQIENLQVKVQWHNGEQQVFSINDLNKYIEIDQGLKM